jgi:hypothetical protein
MCQTKTALPAVTLYARLLIYLLFCIFTQLSNSRLVLSYSESYAVSSFHLKASQRSYFIYCIAEHSCSQGIAEHSCSQGIADHSCSRENVDAKNDSAANANLGVVWYNLALFSTHLKLGFYRFYDVLSLEYAPKFHSFNSTHLGTRSLVEIFLKCNCLVSEFWKWLNMA